MRPLRLLTAVVDARPVPGLFAARGRTRGTPPVSLSGASGTAPAPDRPARVRTRARALAWAELLRVSALFTVPGDALAGAAAAGLRPNRGTALAVGASLCLYEAGMALNDWADREEDAVDRPHRPIPSGRVTPGAALTAAAVLTAAGLSLAARANRPSLAVATALATTVWAYDLHLKRTHLGPTAMATARSLNLLLGATATGTRSTTTHPTGTRCGATHPTSARSGAMRPGATRPAAGRSAQPTVRGAAPRPRLGADGAGAASGVGREVACAALLLGAHTYGVTAVSRHEARGGSTAVPLAVLAATVTLGAAVAGGWRRPGGPPPVSGRGGSREHLAPRLLLTTLTGAYLRTAAPPLVHAALNPSAPLTQRAVGGGIRAMIPLQAALAARAGAPLAGLAVTALAPLARKLARKVSPT